jgi:putrescine transport system substrate-binding protein
MRAAKHVGKEIIYCIPKDTGILWIDCAGIPRGAPHPENAHKFLNFLLSKETGAKITNNSGVLVNIPGAIKLFNTNIVNNDQICPTDPEILRSLRLGQSSHNAEDMEYEREAAKEWSRFKMNTLIVKKGGN